MAASDKATTEKAKVVQPPRIKGGRTIAYICMIVLLSVGSGLGGAWLLTRDMQHSPYTLQSGVDGNKIVTSEEQDIASVASKVSPSVVSILTQSQTASYFGQTQVQEGAGTGIIISANGYIMTNKHVIQGSQTVTVVTSDGVSHSNVRVVGTDPLNDLAFLKISGVGNLKPAELGDSTSIRIGQSVVAIGNALGQYENTVTSGIISGIGRSVTASTEGADQSDMTSSQGASETLSDLIQTDAAINPGNSGGPLVNVAGQVVGINTAIASNANGLGFTIPISAAKGVIKGVLETGKVQHAYLGVSYVTITPDVAKHYNLSMQVGAYVHGDPAVAADSPAEKADIKDGDVIVKVNDITLGASGSVSSLIGQYAPGTKVTLTIIRDGKTQTIDVTLAAYTGAQTTN